MVSDHTDQTVGKTVNPLPQEFQGTSMEHFRSQISTLSWGIYKPILF